MEKSYWMDETKQSFWCDEVSAVVHIFKPDNLEFEELSYEQEIEFEEVPYNVYYSEKFSRYYGYYA